mgnify:CR=1 FL=1
MFGWMRKMRARAAAVTEGPAAAAPLLPAAEDATDPPITHDEPLQTPQLPASLAERVTLLADLGLHLSDSADPSDIAQRIDPNEADTPLAWLSVMGSLDPAGQTDGGSGHYSDDVWHFDSRAIRGHGSYRDIATQLQRLARPLLDGHYFSDYVDLVGQAARLTVVRGDDETRWDLGVQDEVADLSVFQRMNEELAGAGTERRFALYPSTHRYLIVCKRPDQISAINERFGLLFTAPSAT